MRCGEDHRERRALADAHEHSALGADRVHDRADVVHALLERPERGGVREAHPALVEEDEAGEAGKPLHEASVARLFPVGLEVRQPAHDEDEVDVARPEHLVGDVHLARAGVANLGKLVVHARELMQRARASSDAPDPFPRRASSSRHGPARSTEPLRHSEERPRSGAEELQALAELDVAADACPRGGRIARRHEVDDPRPPFRAKARNSMPFSPQKSGIAKFEWFFWTPLRAAAAAWNYEGKSMRKWKPAPSLAARTSPRGNPYGAPCHRRLARLTRSSRSRLTHGSDWRETDGSCEFR